MTIPWALAVPVIIFLTVIVPLWITFHYITVWARLRSDKQTGRGGEKELDKLRTTAQHLEQRLESIETILDHEAPNWRHK